ncbi:MAG: hypothetical protein KDB69_10280 [Acidimicrobiia bacterium]|nr:hypothetical protein [Acidimicrobiia bacterium]
MAIVLFILIAGLWAAFLLPSFFDHRSRAPKATTRDFARTRAMLATVAQSQPDTEGYSRRYTQTRRRQVLVGLIGASLATLVFATWTGSVAWLWVNVVVNVTIAGYVTVLLSLKQNRAAQRRIVVPIDQAPRPLTAVPPQDSYATDEAATVRVIAG